MSKCFVAFVTWYESVRSTTGFPPRGTIGAALVVLDRLKSKPDLEIDAHMAPGGAQVKGVSGAAIKKILAEFGEQRKFAEEGGRTNRGARGHIESLLRHLKQAEFDHLSDQERQDQVMALQVFLVDQVKALHARKRLEPSFDERKTTRDFVRQLLKIAQERQQHGQVAQYLVGAKLEARFPGIAVENFSYSTSDQQQGRCGDFTIGDTAFHVTVSPMSGV